jgi:hypothetical protein
LFGRHFFLIVGVLLFCFKLHQSLKNSNIVIDEKVDLVAEFEKILDSIEKTQIQKDINDQKKLFEKWSKEQTEELKVQLKNFQIAAKKEEILKCLAELETQEERLTFFDNQTRVRFAYFNKGFPIESPSKIPVEPAETEFKELAKRHFKIGKHKRDYDKPKPLSRTKILQREALKKIYVDA